LYEKVYSMENLELAHRNARKHKTWYKEVKMIDENPEPYLKELQDMLINHTYKTSDYVTFKKAENGKIRDIYKLPYFPDRICQWAILQVIEPMLMKKFVKNTYSAIPGRGIHKCLKDVTKDMRTDVVNCQYCLKIDVRKFYPSIDHRILKKMYRSFIKDKELLWLLDEIIDSTEGVTGIPIGNYLSQYSGNLYLTYFDHWLKEVKHVKHCYRYMDDVTIFGKTKNELHQLRKDIDEYFMRELKVRMKDNYQVFPTYTRGIDFVGYRIYIDHTILRKSTYKTFRKNMLRLRKKMQHGEMMNYHDFCCYNSYIGWLKYCDSYHLKQKYMQPLERYVNFYYECYLKKGGLLK